MNLTDSDLILVTGATGLVGSHVAEQARRRNLRVRALVRSTAETSLLRSLGVELAEGDMDDPESLKRGCRGATVVIHCAAKVGDWGPTEAYRRVNVRGTEQLINTCLAEGCLKRWIQISSLGVYSGAEHFGTDESTLPNTSGIDGYTLTKVESEKLVCRFIQDRGLPAVVLRPGFIYGPRDRTVLPRLLERLEGGRFAYLGDNSKLMNNTYVGNLCEAIWLAIDSDEVVGEVFNIRDPRSVTKKEFIETICTASGIPLPRKTVPIFIARFLAWHMEHLWRLLGLQSAPLLNSARIKFLGMNLDFDISKAGRLLNYRPTADFRDAMPTTIASFSN
ncbi:MAG: NAD-dependent epimerase/dehydratase family protein [Planctomycetaceae bacterium]